MAFISLSNVFESTARRHRRQPAVMYGERHINADQLVDESRRVASGLAALGVRSGDRVAVWMPNAPSYLAVFLACARLGAIVVHVNSRFKSAELGDILGRSGARVLVYWPSYRGVGFDEILADVDAAVRADITIVDYGEDGDRRGSVSPGRRTVAYETLAGASPLAEDRARPESGCAIFTTSGTTRAPKFVLHTHESIGRHARDVATDFDYVADDARTLLMLPLCGVFGFAQAMASLAAGAPIVMLPQFDAGEAALAIVRHRVTQTNGTDDMFMPMLEARAEERPFPSLHWAGFAAFNMAAEAAVATAQARGVRLCGLYGTSELQALFAHQPMAAPLARRALAGGRPVSPQAGVRVRDPESGRLLSSGEAGELELAGPSRMAGYYGDAEATSRALTEDGYVRTGDLGYASEDGGFVFQSRMGDAIRLSGFLVNPIEIESCVQKHPTIAAAQVVAVPHGGRNRAVAFVRLRAGAGLDEAAIAAFCRQRMANFKTPERFVALDEFPVAAGPNGVKIQRGVLRQMALRLLATQR